MTTPSLAFLWAALVLAVSPAPALPPPPAGPQEADTAVPAEVPQEAEPAFFRDTLSADTLPVERIDADQRTALALRAIFQRVDALQDVRVQVEAGVVRLSGTALSHEAREQAAALARGMEGVVFVDNRIREVTSLSARLRPTLDRLGDRLLDFVAYLPLLLTALLVVGVFSLLGAGLGRLGATAGAAGRNVFLANLLRQGLRVAVLFVGVYLALELLEATRLMGALLGTAGVLGIALGFAFRDIGENYLAGLILSLRQPFAPNDHIVLDGHEGKVVRLTARETILMTPAGNHVRIPNSTIFRSVIVNYTRNPLRRFDFKLSVGTADDLANAMRAGVSALREMEGVLEDPRPFARVVEVGDSWVTLGFFAWVHQGRAEFGKARSEAIRLVKERLEREGVSMPSPEFSVRLGSADRSPPPSGTRDRGAPVPEDVSVEDPLEEQIARDRRTSPEPNLLDPRSVGGG